MDKMYYTYVRYNGLGWFLGWFMVGMSLNGWGGYVNDFACEGNCKILLMQIDSIAPERMFFWPPKGANIIEVIKIPKNSDF